jgi:hypothetical protein
MISRKSNVANGRDRIISHKSSLAHLSSCFLTMARPPRDDDTRWDYPSKHSDRLVEERVFYYKQTQQQYHRNKSSSVATLPAHDSVSFSVSFDSWSSQRRETPNPDCRHLPLATGCMGEGWDEVFFPVHFPERSYTVTEVCLDDGDRCDGNDVAEICLDDYMPRARTTAVVRCDDNSIWSDFTDEDAGYHKSGGSLHWRESDEHAAARAFVPPDDIVFVRSHVECRFEI